MSSIVTCALPGDSGGPVFNRNGIVGIISSTGASLDAISKGKCDREAGAFYVPISDILDQIRQKNLKIIIPKPY